MAATYKLDIDVSNIVKKYKDAITEMKNAGAKESITKGLEQQLDSLEKKFNELAASGKVGFANSRELSSFVTQVQRAYGKLSTLGQRMSTSTQQDGFLSEGRVAEIKKSIKSLKEEAKKIKAETKDILSGFSFSDNQIKSIEKATDKVAALNEQIGKTRVRLESAKKKAQDSFNEIMNNNGKTLKSETQGIFGKQLADWSEDYQRGNVKSGQGKNKRTEIVNNFNEIIKTAQTFEQVWDKIGADVEDLYTKTKAAEIKNTIQSAFTINEQNIANAKNTLEAATTELDNFNKAAKTENINKLLQSFSNLESKEQEIIDTEQSLSKAAKEDNNVIDKLRVSTDGLTSATEEAADASRNQGVELINSAKAAEQAEDEFNHLFDSFTRIFSITALFTSLRKVIRDTFNDIQQLDQAYASIAYVTNETVAQLWSTYDEYSSMAEKLGQSTVDVIKASAIYRQQGLDTAEALELTTDTMKLATIAGNDYSKATQEMTAALRGFKMEMDEGAHVSDVYSELAAHAAASVDGIAQAMSRTASIANSAGMSFENTSAFLTQMIETTQESAENIGTSMKTIIARFTELKKNVAGTSESEFADLDFNKVDAALKSVGVQLKDTTGQFRNLDEVFLELSAKWDSLDRNTQRYIATIAAGSRQQSRFIAMMDNYERTAELIEIAQDSAGKAEEQFSKAADTISFKLNTLKTNWEEFRLSFTSSDFAKGLIDELGIAVNSLKDSNKLALAVAIPFGVVFVRAFLDQVKKTFQVNTGALSSLSKTIGNMITNGIDVRIANKIKEGVDKAKADVARLQNELKATTSKGIITLINDEDKAKFEAVKAELSNLVASMESYKDLDSFEFAGENLDNFRQKLVDIELTEEQISEILEDIYGESLAEVNSELAETEREVNRINGEIQQNEQVINDAESASSKFASAILAGVGPGVTQGLQTLANTAGLVTTMLLSGADAAQTMKVAMVGLGTQSINMLASMIPQLVDVIAKQRAVTVAIEANKQAAVEAAATANAALASTGIGALVVAAGMLLTLLVKIGIESYKNQKTEEQLHEIRLKNLQESAQALKETVKTQESEIKNAEELIKKYDELSAKTVLTTEEQEEYNKLIEDIQDQFPEIISAYDAAGEKVRIQRDYWQKIVDLQKEALNYNKQNQNYVNTALAEERLYNIDSNYKKSQNTYTGAAYAYELIDRNQTNEVGFKRILKEYGLTVESFGDFIGQPLKESLTFDEIKQVINQNSNDIRDELVKQSDTMKKQYEADKQVQEYIKRQSIAESVLLNNSNINEANANIAADWASNRFAQPTLLEGNILGSRNYIDENAKLIQSVKNGDIISQLYRTIQESRITTENGLPVLGDYGSAATFQDNLPEWQKLPAQLKEYLNSIQIDAEKWEEVRKDDEDWKQYAVDIATWIEQYTIQKLAEGFDKLPLTDEQSNELLNGDLTPNQLDKKAEELTTGMSDDVATSIEAYIASIKGMTQESADLLSKFGIEAGDITQNRITEMANQFTALINAVGGEDAAKTLINNFKDYNPEDIAKFFSKFSFDDVNALNNEQMRERAIEYIKDIFNVSGEEAAKTYEGFITAVHADINKLSSGDLNEYQARLKNIEDAFSTNGKTFSKVINGSGKLAASEVSTFSKALDDFNKKAGTSFKLSDYFNPETGKVDRLKLKQDLQDISKEFDKFKEKAVAALNAQREALGEDAYQEMLNFVEEIGAYVPSVNYQISVAIGKLTDIKALLEDIENLTSTISGVTSQFISDGFVSSKSMEQLSEVMGEDFNNNVGAYVNEQMQLNIDLLNQYIKKKLEEAEASLVAGHASELEVLQLKALSKEYDNYLKEQTKQIEDKEKELSDAYKAHADAVEDVAEKQKALNEAIKDYNDLLYGSENRKSSLDNLYNYQEAIAYFTDELARSKDLLNDSKGYDEASKNLARYLSSAHSQLVEYAAQNKVIEDGLAKRRDNLLNGGASYEGINVRFGDYVKIDDRTGLAAIDQRLLQEARFADKWKDQLEAFVDDYNKYSQELLKNEDAMLKAEKEILKLREEATKKWADFEKDIAETLKDEYKEQVDELKARYESMKAADDDYLNALQEAIEKQRKLRERENKWEELAEKEKQLALMRRDTSGANQVETKKLEKDIQKDREQMLDDSIDSIIENMQKLTEKQDELRDAEVELKEALLDDALYWNLTAENVAQSFNSVDEFLAWSVQHHKEYIELTAAQRQQFLDDQSKKFDEAIGAAAVLANDAVVSIEDQIRVTADEVNQIVDTTGEAFTTEVDRVMRETSEALNKEIEDAQKKIEDATKALADANEKLAEAAKKIDEIADSINNIHGGSWKSVDWSESTPESSSPREVGEQGEIYAARAIRDAVLTNNGRQDLADILDEYDYDESLMKGALKDAFDSTFGRNTGNAGIALSAASAYFDENKKGVVVGKRLSPEAEQQLVSDLEQFGLYFARIGEDLYAYPSRYARAEHIGTEQQAARGTLKVKQYKKGGLADYTGPAWVDGTPSEPEAFLNSEDTERIGNAAKLLADIPQLSRGNISTTNTSYGDTNIEVNLYIDHISSDVDVEDMLDRVKKDIVEVARPLGTNVILQQQV